MKVKVGILGIGFMGKMHFDNHRKNRMVKLAAICDVDRKKRSGDWSGIAGNIGGAGKKTNLKGIEVYSRAEDMFRDKSLDVIDITLPTYLHTKYAIMAFKAGKHVICEKPLASNSRDAARIAAAAAKARRRLFVAQCIRFWPHYAVARDIVKSGRYGKVISACFRRFSPTPTWTWRNWILDPKKSGVAALDLHIHDADYVTHVFGKPRAVTSNGAGFRRGRFDHIITSYEYPGGALVMAEGGWEFAAGYPFNMSFTIVMEKATLNCPADLAMALHPTKGGAKRVGVPAGDGYGIELAHFVKCIARKKGSEVVTPLSAVASVKLIEHEVKSARTGRKVRVRI